MDYVYAPSEIRDRFLRALDADERLVVIELARELTACNNPLPGMVSEQLKLPLGSTYGAAARQILAHASNQQ